MWSETFGPAMNFVEPIRSRKKIDRIKNILVEQGRYRDLLLFVVGVLFGDFGTRPVRGHRVQNTGSVDPGMPIKQPEASTAAVCAYIAARPRRPVDR
jgi:hypothetical protein